MKRFKNITYAYPSSIDAQRFGHAADGCWILEIVGDDGKTVDGFIDAHYFRVEAFEQARKLDLPFYRYSFKVEEVA